MAESGELHEEKNYGKVCIFCSRLCGIFAAMLYLLCGFGALIPGPSIAPGTSYTRCLAVGLIMIVAAVVVFFLEATFLGNIVPRLEFLLAINKYLKHWMRSALYILFALIPLMLWCMSISTIIGLGVMFAAGMINFMLVIGTKGDHSEVLAERNRRVKFSEVSTKVEEGEASSS
ncbi:uncharacterized protein LOC135342788 [Halichondria panicea]|uniref:uncharacterized protein LOC135342788 n=1 Tax=Halichondria panicea TaxID=6063 RepID=UPI00312B44B5